jgi:hypothetical protein
MLMVFRATSRYFAITYSFDPNNPKPVAELGSASLQPMLRMNTTYSDKPEGNLWHQIRYATLHERFDSNPAVETYRFENFQQLTSGSGPKQGLFLHPGLFSWMCRKQESESKGGTGIFTGRLPFVWFTNSPQTAVCCRTP